MLFAVVYKMPGVGMLKTNFNNFFIFYFFHFLSQVVRSCDFITLHEASKFEASDFSILFILGSIFIRLKVIFACNKCTLFWTAQSNPFNLPRFPSIHLCYHLIIFFIESLHK